MFERFKQGLSAKAKMTIGVVLLVVLAGGSIGGYKVWDYKENNPKFCMGCHLMQEAYDKWAVSEHKDVNCHDCHHLSIKEQNMLLVKLVLHNPKEVPERHGKVIVPWKLCANCHIETNEKFPDAMKVTHSPFHAKHFFMAQLECSKCHGYKLHEFLPEPRFCAGCHPDNEKVHGMEELACLNCHNDKNSNLIPARDTCLACHGSEEQRAKIAAEFEKSGVKYIKPTPEEAAKAAKLTTFPAEGAMQFECYKCHHPHGKIKPVVDADCVPCHGNMKVKGKHAVHIEMGLTCLQCHKPHLWTVTKAMGKSKQCTQCHGPVDPANFLK